MSEPISKPEFGSADFAEWFESQRIEDQASEYVNLRLSGRPGSPDLRQKIGQYFEWAHADARRFFHDNLGVSLDPRGGPPPTEYPQSLPLTTLKGYFGEVLCGILAESGQVHHDSEWTVPLFLFRLHQQAEEYLMRLITGESAAARIVGRTGSDCLALSLDPDGTVKAILAAEAKCYRNFNITKALEALEDLGLQAAVPVSLGQMKRLLAEIDPEEFEETILDLERIIKNARQSTIPRRDLLVLVFENPLENYTEPRISTTKKTNRYHGSRPLHVVEAYLPGAGELIKELYAGLYKSN